MNSAKIKNLLTLKFWIHSLNCCFINFMPTKWVNWFLIPNPIVFKQKWYSLLKWKIWLKTQIKTHEFEKNYTKLSFENKIIHHFSKTYSNSQEAINERNLRSNPKKFYLLSIQNTNLSDHKLNNKFIFESRSEKQ